MNFYFWCLFNVVFFAQHSRDEGSGQMTYRAILNVTNYVRNILNMEPAARLVHLRLLRAPQQLQHQHERRSAPLATSQRRLGSVKAARVSRHSTGS